MVGKEDIITLNAEEYNRLRDFEGAVLRENVIKIWVTAGGREMRTYLSRDEAIIEIEIKNKELKEEGDTYFDLAKRLGKEKTGINSENNNLKREINRLNAKLSPDDSPSNPKEERYRNAFKKLKEMSIWGFIKWRKE